MDRFSLKNKTILISGGSGFFGGQIISALLQKKAKIINIDIKKNKYRKMFFFIKQIYLQKSNFKEAYTKLIKKFKKLM